MHVSSAAGSARPFDLTMPLDGAIRISTSGETQITRMLLTADWLQRLNELRLSPFNVTHVDLPNAYRWGQLGVDEREPDAFGRHYQWLHEEPDRTFPCLLIDVTSYAVRMQAALRDVGANYDAAVPRCCWQGTEEGMERLGLLLEELAISREQLERLPWPGTGAIAVFITGWRQFAPPDGNLESVAWIPWHPYLLNPYLPQEAVDYLLCPGQGPEVAGVGCDMHGLDYPLRQLYPSDGSGVLRSWEAYRGLLDELLAGSSNPNPTAALRPLHVGSLPTGKLIIEQLYIPPELQVEQAMQAAPGADGAGFPCVAGRLTLYPFAFRGAEAAVVTAAHFHLDPAPRRVIPVTTGVARHAPPPLSEDELGLGSMLDGEAGLPVELVNNLKETGRTTGEWALALPVLRALNSLHPLGDYEALAAACEMVLTEAQLRAGIEALERTKLVRVVEEQGLVAKIELEKDWERSTAALVQARADLSQECREWLLKRRLASSTAEVEGLFQKLTGWLRSAEPGDLVAALGPTGADDGGAGTSVCDDPEVRGILDLARKLAGAGSAAATPIGRYAITSVIARLLAHVLASGEEAPGGSASDRVNLIVDTNLVLDVIVPTRRDHRLVCRQLSLLAADGNGARVRLWVSSYTLDEVCRVLRRVARRCRSVVLSRQVDSGNVSAEVLDFLTNGRDVNVRDYMARKLNEARGGVADCPDWAPCLLRDAVPSDWLEEAVGRLRTRVTTPRDPESDRHDAALVQLAASLDAAQERERWYVWTKHMALRPIAKELGLDPRTVLRNVEILGVLSLEGSPLDTVQAAAASWFAAPEPAEAGTASARTDLLLRRLFQAVPAAVVPQAGRIASTEFELALIPDALVEDVEEEEPADISLAVPSAGWIDLSIDWGLAPGGHGPMPLRKEQSVSFGPPRPRVYYWRFSPHACTHMDLPWAVNIGDDPEAAEIARQANVPPEESRKAQERYDELVEPRSVEAIFVNATRHLAAGDEIFGAEREIWRFRFNHDPASLGQWLADSVRRLRITGGWLREALRGVDCRDKALILHTGWAASWLRHASVDEAGRDLSSYAWELLSPWLLHPWLDVAAVRSLLGRPPALVGIDAPMADCPLYVAEYGSPLQTTVQEVIAKLREKTDFPLTQPAHTNLLGRGIPLIEGLAIPPEVADWYGGQPAVKLELGLVPLRLPLMMDCALLKVLARRPLP